MGVPGLVPRKRATFVCGGFAALADVPGVHQGVEHILSAERSEAEEFFKSGPAGGDVFVRAVMFGGWPSDQVRRAVVFGRVAVVPPAVPWAAGGDVRVVVCGPVLGWRVVMFGW